MTAKTERSPLADLLLEMGLVDREQLSLALQHQRANGGRLGRILAERKLVDEDRLAKAIASRLGLEAVNLSSLKIHERVLALIPGNVALKYGALPIAIKRTHQAEFVYVVMADPLDSEALAELARVSGREIRVLVATATELDRALDQHYRPTAVKPPALGALPAEPSKSAPLPVPQGVAQPPPLSPPSPQKTDPAAAAAQKRGLPPPSATGNTPVQQPKPRPPAAVSTPAGAAVTPSGAPAIVSSSPPPPMAPRLELPRAKTGNNVLPPSMSSSSPPPAPIASTARPPIQPEKKSPSALPPLPDRRTIPPPAAPGSFHTPSEKTSQLERGTQTDRAQTERGGSQTDRGGSPFDRLDRLDRAAQSDRNLSFDRGSQTDRGTPYDRLGQSDRGSQTDGLRGSASLDRNAVAHAPSHQGERTLPAERAYVPPPAPQAAQRPEPSRSAQTPLPTSAASPPLPRAQAPSSPRPTLPPLISDGPRTLNDLPAIKPAPRTSPSQSAALPPLRRDAPARDTQQELVAEKKLILPTPLQAPRIPTAEEDKTGLDIALDSSAILEELKRTPSTGDVENTLGEWDRAVRDWPRMGSSPSISTSQTLPPDGLPLRAQLGEPAAAQSVSASTLGSPVHEPVTTEQSLKELGLSADGLPIAVASDLPTSIPQSSSSTDDEVQVEILEIAEGVDDIKTSQVELTEDYEMLILRGVMPEAADGIAAQAERPSHPPPKKRSLEPFALEIPIDISDALNPFDGPENIDIPVGLERTGIIPAIDWENEEFIPPPLSKQPIEPLLAGTDDIPTSGALARARSEAFEPADNPRDTNDEITVDPLHRAEPRFDTLLEARAAAQELDEAPRRKKSDPPAPMLLTEEVYDDEPDPSWEKNADEPSWEPRGRDTPSEASWEARGRDTPEDVDRAKLSPSDDSDSSEMPVIEPSSLVSLMDDDGSAKVEDTGADQAPIIHGDSNGALPRTPSTVTPPPPPTPAPTLLFDERDRQLSPVKSARAPKEKEFGEEETNPRIDRNSVRAALAGSTLVDEPSALEKIEDPTPPRDTVDRDGVFELEEGMFVGPPQTLEMPRSAVKAEAQAGIAAAIADEDQRMVEALAQNDSLNSAERAQLVLAIGRLLLQKGLITKAELAAELKK